MALPSSRLHDRASGPTSRTGSPMCSATCPARPPWPCRISCWAPTTTPRPLCLWRHLSGLSPLGVPAAIVADWRADLPALCPSILAFSERRRRRMRDRSRKGDDLRRVFEMAALSDLDDSEGAIAI